MDSSRFEREVQKLECLVNYNASPSIARGKRREDRVQWFGFVAKLLRFFIPKGVSLLGLSGQFLFCLGLPIRGFPIF